MRELSGGTTLFTISSKKIKSFTLVGAEQNLYRIFMLNILKLWMNVILRRPNQMERNAVFKDRNSPHDEGATSSSLPELCVQHNSYESPRTVSCPHRHNYS